MDTSIAVPDEPDPLPVFVLATAKEPTRHALAVARALCSDRHAPLGVITAPQEPVTVSSARANVHALAVDDWDPYPFTSPDVVCGLVAAAAPDARVIVGRSMESKDVSALLPSHATVVLSGAIRRFLESREQRLGRQLTKAGYDVVFIACR